jgi:hypothetical protein
MDHRPPACLGEKPAAVDGFDKINRLFRAKFDADLAPFTERLPDPKDCFPFDGFNRSESAK